MNGWIYRFEWLSLYNPSVSGVFQQTESIYTLKKQFKQQKIEILSKFTWLIPAKKKPKDS